MQRNLSITNGNQHSMTCISAQLGNRLRGPPLQERKRKREKKKEREQERGRKRKREKKREGEEGVRVKQSTQQLNSNN